MGPRHGAAPRPAPRHLSVRCVARSAQNVYARVTYLKLYVLWTMDVSPSQNESSISVAAAPIASAVPDRKRGRPAAVVRGFFERVEGTYNPKTKRGHDRCKQCGHTVKQSKAEALLQHLLECKEVTPEIRRSLLEGGGDSPGLSLCSSGPSKKERLQTKRAVQSTLHGAITVHKKLDDATRVQAHKTLLLWLAKCNIPFTAPEDQFFLDFCELLNPAYTPPGDACGTTSRARGSPAY